MNLKPAPATSQAPRAEGSADEDISKAKATIDALSLKDWAGEWRDVSLKIFAWSDCENISSSDCEERLSHGITVFRQLVASGDPKFQYIMSQLLELEDICPHRWDNKGTEHDRLIIDYIRRAAEQGFAPAQYLLAFQYQQGNTIAQDYAQAIVWYRKSAEQGYRWAQTYLAALYENGQGAPKDLKQARFWMQKAADGGA